MTASTRGSKPRKPRKNFPLFATANGQWAAKVNGRTCYFGRWADPSAAERRYLAEVEDLRAGRPVGQKRTGQFTIRDAVNAFLDAKRHAMDTGDLSPHTWKTYYQTCGRLVEVFGKTRPVESLVPADFQRLRTFLAKGRAPITLGQEIIKARIVLKYCHDNGLIDKHPRFGSAFATPRSRAMRLAKAARAPRIFSREELHTILAAADSTMQAMVHLALNCGFGNDDVARLPVENLDLTTGWVSLVRQKTGTPRRAPLWPETVALIAEAIETRDSGYAFLRPSGKPWASGDRNYVSIAFRELLNRLDLWQTGRGFYALRHCHRTIADGSRDQRACDAIMGHCDGHMSNRYVESVSDERLLNVTNEVRNWLYG